MKWEYKRIILQYEEELEVDSSWELVCVIANGTNREYYLKRCL